LGVRRAFGPEQLAPLLDNEAAATVGAECRRSCGSGPKARKRGNGYCLISTWGPGIAIGDRLRLCGASADSVLASTRSAPAQLSAQDKESAHCDAVRRPRHG